MKTISYPTLFSGIFRGLGTILLLISSALVGALIAALLHIFTDFFNSKPANQSLTLIYQLFNFYAQFSVLAAVLIGPLLIGCLKLMRVLFSIVVCVLCGIVVACVPLCILIALTLFTKDIFASSHLLSEISFVAMIALIAGATGGGFFGVVWKFFMRNHSPGRVQ